MDLNTDIWNEFKTTDSGVKVLVTGTADNLRSAYFKNQTRRASAPTIFNEYLAYKLAIMLNYPVPKVQFLRFGNELGIISINMPESAPFQGFPKENLLSLLEDSTVFAKIAAFDFWIKAADRHDRNLIVQHTGLNKYKVYMIDHEHTLFGADQNAPNILEFTNIIRIENFKSYVSTPDLLIQEATAINRITDDEIKGLIDTVQRTSDGAFTTECATLIKELLIQRKPLLQEKLIEWYNS